MLIEPRSVNEFFTNLCTSEDTYFCPLEMSENNTFRALLWQPPSYCFINNYFHVVLKVWNENVDIQPISNGNKTIIYICFYLSKEEGTRLNAMKQTLRESMEKKPKQF